MDHFDAIVSAILVVLLFALIAGAVWWALDLREKSLLVQQAQLVTQREQTAALQKIGQDLSWYLGRLATEAQKANGLTRAQQRTADVDAVLRWLDLDEGKLPKEVAEALATKAARLAKTALDVKAAKAITDQYPSE